MGMNHFETLGLEQGATFKQIKKAYRKLAQEYHPDHGGNEDKFNLIKQAYEALTGKVSSITIDSAIDAFMMALRDAQDPTVDLISIAVSKTEKKIFRLFEQITDTQRDIDLAYIVLGRLSGEKTIPDALRDDIQTAKNEITEYKKEIEAQWEIISYLNRFTYRSDHEETRPTGNSRKSNRERLGSGRNHRGDGSPF